MVLGYHVIFGAYGFWLPNDPRGSWSNFVGDWELYRYGRATKTEETHSLAYRDHNQEHRLDTKKSLKHPAVQFTGAQARAIGERFGSYVRKSNLVVWACAVLPDHVHLVIGCPRIRIEQLVIQLKGEATQSLLCHGIHPFGQPTEKHRRSPKCFARGEWKVYLNCSDDVLRAIRYVEENPIKEGKPRQHWSFVTPFDPSTMSV